ncbi:site-2 protease family protein [Sporolactobacillus sp. STCC-11]|uniref:site-2 protease family protein n=1 Tax=Sporolactobacillus caesalpiniae TaxID=3230362 RepID=UPI0033962CF9
MTRLFPKIRIHPVFWLIIAAGTLTGHLWDTTIAFTIVLIHELGHAVMARWFEWKVIEIELLPFGGVAKLDEQEEHPFYQECLVLIAGPLQNVWLPLLSYAMMALPFWGTEQHQIFLAQNSALLLFNLLPIWPLDGGRLLHMVLEIVYPFKHAYKRALCFSLGALFLFGMLAVWRYPFSINLWVIISFIMLAIYKEWRVLPLRFIRFLLAFSGSKQKFLRLKRLAVPEETPLVDVFAMYYKNAEHRIRIVGENHSDIDGKVLANEYFKGHCEGKTISDWR